MTNPVPPPPPSGRPEEENVPRFLPPLIYYTLRAGVAVWALLALIGIGLLLSGTAGAFSAAAFHGTPFSLSGLVKGLATFKPADVLLLGFLVLIVTPLFRVVISVVSFAIARDRAFTVLTVSVLLLLGVSVVIGSYA